jgi:hypothetical protein
MSVLVVEGSEVDVAKRLVISLMVGAQETIRVGTNVVVTG